MLDIVTAYQAGADLRTDTCYITTEWTVFISMSAVGPGNTGGETDGG